MLRAVIFDMDGVLADSHPSQIRAWRKFLLRHGRQMTESDIELLRSGRKKEELLGWFLGDLTRDQIRACNQEKDSIFQKEIGNTSAIAGTRELLHELSRAAVLMAVASCGSGARVEQTLKLLQIRHYFRAVVTGDDVIKGKPDPTIYRIAAAQLRVQPAESLVFEDSVAGVLAATAAGIKVVGIADQDRALALVQAGALDAIPDFTGLSFRHVEDLFFLKSNNGGHYGISSYSSAIG